MVGFMVITPWKIVGYIGTSLFSLRWLVQAYATKKANKSVVPVSFWWISFIGSALTFLYFVFGKNDSVGVLSTLFPMIMSVYNIKKSYT